MTKEQETWHCNFSSCFVWIWNVVSYFDRRTFITSHRKQNGQDNKLTWETNHLGHYIMRSFMNDTGQIVLLQLWHTGRHYGLYMWVECYDGFGLLLGWYDRLERGIVLWRYNFGNLIGHSQLTDWGDRSKTLKLMWGNGMWGWEVNRFGSGSCPMGGFGINGVEPLGSAATKLVQK